MYLITMLVVNIVILLVIKKSYTQRLETFNSDLNNEFSNILIPIYKIICFKILLLFKKIRNF